MNFNKITYKKEILLFGLLFPLIIYFEHTYFNYFLLFTLLIHSFSKIKIDKNISIVIKFNTVFFYFSRYIYSFKKEGFVYPEMASDIFFDMQLFLLSLKCNSEVSFSYKFMFSNQIFNCPVDIGFGPTSEQIKYPFDVWYGTLLIAILVFIFILFFIIKFKLSEQNLFIYLMIISPSFIFLFEQLNLDILIFIVLSTFIYYYDKLPKSIFYLTIVIFTSIKIYPIGFLLGSMVLSYSKKDRGELLKSGFFTTICLAYLYYYFILNNFELGTIPYNPLRTIGIYSDYLSIVKFYGLDFYGLKTGLITFFILFFISLINSFIEIEKYKTKNDEIFLLYLPTFLIISVYANYAYKLIYLMPLFWLLHNSLKEGEKIISYIMFLSTPSIFIFDFLGGKSIFEFFFIIISRVGYYYLFILCITVGFSIFFKNWKKVY